MRTALLNKVGHKEQAHWDKRTRSWGEKVSSVVFLILTKHGIAGQRARDEERRQKADRTEGGRGERGKTSRAAGWRLGRRNV